MVNIEVTGGSPFDVNQIMSAANITPKDILAKRIVKTFPGLTEPEAIKKEAEIKKSLSEDSPALIGIRQEIANANALLKTVINNIALLATPITAASAGMTIGGMLPDLLKILSELGLLDKLPAGLITAINTITSIIAAVNLTISPINSALQVLLAPSNPDFKFIPLPPDITITGL